MASVLDAVFGKWSTKQKEVQQDVFSQFRELIVAASQEETIDADELERLCDTLGLFGPDKIEWIRPNDPGVGLELADERCQKRLWHLIKQQQRRRGMVQEYRQAIAEEKEVDSLEARCEQLNAERNKWLADFAAKHEATFERLKTATLNAGRSGLIEQNLRNECSDANLWLRQRDLERQRHLLGVERRELVEVGSEFYEWQKFTRELATEERQLEDATTKPLREYSQQRIKELTAYIRQLAAHCDAFGKQKRLDEIDAELSRIDRELVDIDRQMISA